MNPVPLQHDRLFSCVHVYKEENSNIVIIRKPNLRSLIQISLVMYVLTPKIGKYRGSLGSLGEPVRPVVETGQTGLGKVVKMPIGLHHCIDLGKTIEMHMWNI